MQTFLPYKSFEQSLDCLDKQRLGKQRVEASQILNCLNYRKTGDIYMIDKNGRKRRRGWIDHKAVVMWVGYDSALIQYYNTCLRKFAERGGNNIKLQPIEEPAEIIYPHWLGDEEFHASHRSNLLRKSKESFEQRMIKIRENPNSKINPMEVIEWYAQFKWNEPADLPYIWPQGKDELCRSIAI